VPSVVKNKAESVKRRETTLTALQSFGRAVLQSLHFYLFPLDSYRGVFCLLPWRSFVGQGLRL